MVLLIGILVGTGTVLLVAALATWGEARRIGRVFPPAGRFIEVEGRTVHFIDIPADDAPAAAPALVFIHGASGNLHEPMTALAESFSGRYRMIFLDRPGQGWTERQGRGDASPSVQAAVIDHVLAALGVERAVIVGHSWGGAVAAAFGVGFPQRTAGLVFLSAATHPWEGGVHWYYTLASHPVLGPVFTHTLTLPIGRAVFSTTIRSVFSPETPPVAYVRRAKLPLVLRPESFRANAEDVADLHGHVTALSPRYGEIEAPVEVVSGDADRVVYAHIHSTGLARDIPGARLTLLSGAGHMPHHTRTGDVVAAIERVIARARD